MEKNTLKTKQNKTNLELFVARMQLQKWGGLLRPLQMVLCAAPSDVLSAQCLQQVGTELCGDCFKMSKAGPNPEPVNTIEKIPVVFNRLWLSSENTVRVVFCTYTHVH